MFNDINVLNRDYYALQSKKYLNNTMHSAHQPISSSQYAERQEYDTNLTMSYAQFCDLQIHEIINNKHEPLK